MPAILPSPSRPVPMQGLLHFLQTTLVQSLPRGVIKQILIFLSYPVQNSCSNLYPHQLFTCVQLLYSPNFTDLGTPNPAHFISLSCVNPGTAHRPQKPGACHWGRCSLTLHKRLHIEKLDWACDKEGKARRQKRNLGESSQPLPHTLFLQFFPSPFNLPVLLSSRWNGEGGVSPSFTSLVSAIT